MFATDLLFADAMLSVKPPIIDLFALVLMAFLAILKTIRLAVKRNCVLPMLIVLGITCAWIFVADNHHDVSSIFH